LAIFYFIRHGQTEWNLEQRFQGQHGNSPLTSTAYKDIKNLSDFLVSLNPMSGFFVSPIKRAVLTAQEISNDTNWGVDFTIDNRLTEISFGEWEGVNRNDIRTKWPDDFCNYQKFPDKFDATEINAENLEDAANRFIQFVNEKNYQFDNDDNILVVSHGAILQTGIAILLGYPLKDIRKLGGLSNTSTTIVQSSDKKTFNLLEWNKTDYLDMQMDDYNTL
jgi:probable phosphoglycerate mutase